MWTVFRNNDCCCRAQQTSPGIPQATYGHFIAEVPLKILYTRAKYKMYGLSIHLMNNFYLILKY